ncbi:class I SAM-dependent methyltransferase [uncultured Algibacter sp.]|uniref:class I SAM-dependent methyltransferase n=1 Tax=uncultured Algibacter sp. TaxID=298659 RepID=UPI0030EEFDBD|tara:strand:+ start:617 stop:1486 length:870 start_codon:yes stop_codon:yes gene_type:complete
MEEIKNESISNINKNKDFYDKKYKKVNVSGLIKTLNNLDSFLNDATTTDISWVGMYVNNFKDTVKGKKIMELGCGNCANVAVLAALGAEVIANDISEYSSDIINALNANYKFEYDIVFVKGDFTDHNLPKQSLDMVIGKAFLHHLTLEHELEVIKKINQVLKPEGEARFFEPAINSNFLDELRWAVPMDNRPSKLFSPKAFKQWEDSDPHPHRDNSSKHFKQLGHQFFSKTEIIPMGMLERFYRILPFSTKTVRKYRRIALKIEKYAPRFIQYFGARSQTIIYKTPRIN